MTHGRSTLLTLCLLPAACLAIAVHSRCDVTLTVPDPGTQRRSPFTRVVISDAVIWGAVCNDGSDGIYYTSRTTDNSKWIIYLEGGVGCGNLDGCNQRYIDRPELMTSRLYPSSIEGRDILDPDPRANPGYWDYNFVLIPYCTSDLWLGNSDWNSSRRAEPFRFNSSATYNQFEFRGSTVFRRVIEELLYYGFGTASDVSEEQ